MRRPLRSSGRLWRVVPGLILSAAWCQSQPAELIAQQPAPGRIQAHLEAGEFAPALELARGIGDKALREQQLTRIAGAQARTGAASGALATAAELTSGSARHEALSQLGSSFGKGGFGGGTAVDFDSLMNLITSTVAPTTWDQVGGPGSIAPFVGGVWVDAQGMMHRVTEEESDARLDELHRKSLSAKRNQDIRRPSTLRKVSLPRLERALQLRQAMGRGPDESMRLLAGLQRIQYVMVYPATGDVVIAGPAGDWRQDSEARQVSVDTGRPLLQLDDLVVLLRHMDQPNATFGCSIKPLPEALARTQTFLDKSARTPLKPGGRDAWLAELRRTLGPQEIEYYGIDPRTRVAQVLVEADYRMKLIGIGLEVGTPAVPSYLSMIEVAKGKPAPPLGVLRWWFSIRYDAIVANRSREAFELRGQGVQVQSENELLEAGGQRVHTGESEPLNRRFAENFTTHFSELAAKYPIYAELQNLFDLALVGAIVRSQDLDGRVNWERTCFADDAQYTVAKTPAPRRVESVINHRVVNRTQVLAAVSGGVYFDATKVVDAQALASDKSGTADSHHARSAPDGRPLDAWWWD